MSTEKINVDLKGVPQTLLLPLLGRAKCSRLTYSPIRDERAIKLLQSINYDFDTLAKQVGNQAIMWSMARAYHFDEAIKNYLKAHPYATIVNLGAGLETAFYRVDNGLLNWVDLDMPEVIALREKLLPPPARVRYLSKSVLDYSWMDDVKEFGTDVFFFAGGFFMYFTQQQVKSLFLHMANYFPNSEVIFDNVSFKALKRSNKMLKRAQMSGAALQWGVNDSKALEAWTPKIKIRQQTGYFNRLKNQMNLPWRWRFRMFYFDLFHRCGIIHMKFN